MAERETFKIAFIGLGVMGAPMSGHLANAGHHMTVYNRSPSKMEQWLKSYSGNLAESPEQAANNQDIVITCLGGDEDVDQVVLGNNGVLAGASEGSLIIDHTTTSANIARSISTACERKQISFFDAPLSGGQFGAEKGTLSILVGGDQKRFPVVETVLRAYAKAVFLMGPAGSGQVTKMVNQILIAGIFESLAEGLNFAMRSGLDMEHAIDVLKQCTGHSWQMDHRADNMVKDKFDYGFAVNLIHKDLSLCLEEGEAIEAELPITRQIRERYQELIDQGMGKLDATSLLKLLK